MNHFAIKAEGLFSRVCKPILSAIIIITTLVITCDIAIGCNKVGTISTNPAMAGPWNNFDL